MRRCGEGKVCASLTREPQIDYIPMPEVLKAKYQYFTQADIGKLCAAGHARALTPLAEAVGDYMTREFNRQLVRLTSG